MLTAVSTFFGLLVAQDQLEQSEEDAYQKTREQATQVTLWETTGPVLDVPLHADQLHVANGSSAPITSVMIKFAVRVSDSSGSTVKSQWSAMTQMVGHIAPCTELIFQREDMLIRSDTSSELVPVGKRNLYVEAIQVRFTDRNYNRWVRRDWRLIPEAEEEEMPWVTTPKVRSGWAEPRRKPLSSCGSG
ncbi:hypothetical protein [Streptomyces lavendofoliae]|uniref:hypothetical protein n=1 Tax=Streptomyces lavendofoliae TaxID=67314 RepID=UPI003D8F7469